MMSTLRAFFAIQLPHSMNDLFLKGIESLKQAVPDNAIRWVKVENMHITLQFLKSIEQEHIHPLVEAVRIELKNISAFQLELGPLEWFPTARNPKILSLSVSPQDHLTELSCAIGHAIKGLNYPVETRPYRGHLTLGRVPCFRTKYEPLVQVKWPTMSSFVVDEVFLIESKPCKGATYYSPLAQFRLN